MEKDFTTLEKLLLRKIKAQWLTKTKIKWKEAATFKGIATDKLQLRLKDKCSEVTAIC